MARLFDDAATEYLEIDSAVISDVPFTLAAWFNKDELGTRGTLLFVGDKDAGNKYSYLAASGDVGGDPVQAWTVSQAGIATASSTAGFLANTWHHACGVWADTDDRAAFIDGGNKGTANADRDIETPDRTSIGRVGSSAPGNYMSGLIAEAAAWNVALTDVEVAILAKGYSPLFVRPQNLVAYYQLIRDEDQDKVGGYDMTPVNGPGIAAHPPMIYPAPRAFMMAPAGAPAVGQPMMLRGTTVPGLRQWHPRV